VKRSTSRTDEEIVCSVQECTAAHGGGGSLTNSPEHKGERAVSQANGRLAHNKVRVPYVRKPATYTPDFLIALPGKFLMIEVKGLLTESDRAKYKAVRDAYPQIATYLGVRQVELVFVFQNGAGRLNPKNPNSLTYLQWAKQQGFRAIDEPFFPDVWFEEDYTAE
jgi:hypothetical protein